MAGLPWFAVCADFPNHPKTVRLCRKVGNPLGGMYVVNLWAFCVEYQQDGLFTGEDAGAMVEHATGWAGEPGVMLDALIHCGGSGTGFVEPRDSGFYVHEWVERNGAHIAKRQRDAERMREKRQGSESRASVARPSHDRLGGQRQGEGERQDVAAPGFASDFPVDFRQVFPNAAPLADLFSARYPTAQGGTAADWKLAHDAAVVLGSERAAAETEKICSREVRGGISSFAYVAKALDAISRAPKSTGRRYSNLGKASTYDTPESREF